MNEANIKTLLESAEKYDPANAKRADELSKKFEELDLNQLRNYFDRRGTLANPIYSSFLVLKEKGLLRVFYDAKTDSVFPVAVPLKPAVEKRLREIKLEQRRYT